MNLRLLLRALALGAGLGLVWFVVLLLPRFSREELMGMSDRSPARLFVLMVLSSALITAVLPLARLRSSRPIRLGVGFGLPIAGAFIFTSLVLATDLLPELPAMLAEPPENSQGPILDFLGALAGLFLMFLAGVPGIAISAYLQAWFVAIPMGLIHVELASRMDRGSSLPVEVLPRSTS